jgi:hypothetical protein
VTALPVPWLKNCLVSPPYLGQQYNFDKRVGGAQHERQGHASSNRLVQIHKSHYRILKGTCIKGYDIPSLQRQLVSRAVSTKVGYYSYLFMNE